MANRAAPDLPPDLGLASDTMRPTGRDRRHLFKKRNLWMLLFLVFMVSGAMIEMPDEIAETRFSTDVV
ncbi:hypothetical protein [Roseovarius ramblicola]|uniref:Uncharacterized protein n=1 Tax=Roseovarius ramblicola TaxID=2022336 RepID=A0ABV5HW07_9RHOB